MEEKSRKEKQEFERQTRLA